MRFDLPSRGRLRRAVVLRRQRAWDAEPAPPRLPPRISFAVVVFVVLIVALLIATL